MERKKGISMVVLIATITIMLILITTATIAGTTTANNSKKIAFASEISSIESAVKNYASVNDSTYPIKSSVVLDISGAKNEIAQFNDENISSNYTVVLYEIDYEKINITSLKYGNLKQDSNDEYLISLKTGKVYYAKGLQIGSNTYFSYTDDLKDLLEYNMEKNYDTQNSLISFIPNNISWSNQKIDVTVKIPISYIVSSVSVDNDNVTLSSKDSKYYYYVVSKASNYIITVKYKKSSTSSEETIKYSVQNYDVTSPTIQLNKENIVYLSNFSNGQIGYVRIDTILDKQSGIKYVKYEEDSIYTKENLSLSVVSKDDVKSHFEKNGNKVEHNIVPINEGVKKITVYAEDNAGNWTLDSFDITTNSNY